ncbi:MAG: S49 family peptidase [Halorhodospira sp.]
MSEEITERDALLELLRENVREQRRARRWRMFTRLVGLAVVALVVLSLARVDLSPDEQRGPHTAEVRIDGAIMAETSASADRVIQGLERAFEADGVEGVVLRINSPGGSAVHARQIYQEIQRLREAHEDIPLYAVIEDVGASGAYYAAAAAEKIYVNESSLVGSIGVIMGSFGLQEAAEKLGIERRLYTAGEHKAFLDPFSPEQEEEVEHVQTMLDEIHGQFIAAVREGRGERLDEAGVDEDRLFSGLIWTGSRSLELGLADRIGSARSVAREEIGAEERVDYTARGDLFAQLAERFGTAFGRGAYEALQSLDYQVR